MTRRALRLLGAPAVRVGDAVSTLPVDLRTALVAVLALARTPQPRERLAHLFWPEHGGAEARQNLRQLLHRTRTLFGHEALRGGATVELLMPHDLHDLHAALDDGDAVAALRASEMLLLDGMEHVPHREWQALLELERRALEERTRRLVLHAAEAWATGGPPPRALAGLAAWVDRDPLDDDVHAAYLRCARHVPSEAVAAGARLARVHDVIAQEVGGGLTEAVVLASAWLGELRPPRTPPEHAVSTAPPTRGRRVGGDLPLVGRASALRALDDAVDDASTRIVTIHGPGGIGKTRLARAWASRRSGDGSRLPIVDLAGATDPTDATRRLAHAHGWQIDDTDGEERLAARLASVADVLLLDEAEGLPWLPAWVALLADLAPRATIVLTSRERLALAGEQVLRLTGLGVPARDDVDPRASDAVQLFLRAAHRVRADLRPDAGDVAAIARFARRVGGSPFALTVAAGWLQLGPPAKVLDDILEDDGDPLTIGDVVEPSWARLEAPDRLALAALGVFPERFDVDGALAVAACSRSTLRRLIDRSLVEPGTSDGLTLHALVRQHAQRRLAAEPAAAAAARGRHARHVAERLGDLARDIWHGPRQWQAFVRIVDGLADLRRAWEHACAVDDVEVLDALLDTVWCLEIRGWYELGGELTAAAVATLERVAAAHPERAERPLARALARRGIFAQRLGDAPTTRSTAERARAIFERRGERVDPFVWFHLGIAAMLDDDRDGARSWHRHLLAQATEHGDVWAVAGALGNLGVFARQSGDMGAALAYGRASFDARLALEDGWGLTYAAHNLADVLDDTEGDDEEIVALRRLAIDTAARFSMEGSILPSFLALGAALERLGREREAHVAYARARSLLDAGERPAAHGDDDGSDAETLRERIEVALHRLRHAAP